MRALPGDSLEYLGETADGNMAFVEAAAASPGLTRFGGLAGVAERGAGAPSGKACAPDLHWDLRKSFQVIPFSVFAAFAALYLTLHSCTVSACAPRHKDRMTNITVIPILLGAIPSVVLSVKFFTRALPSIGF
jgi:hypothetical protein